MHQPSVTICHRKNSLDCSSFLFFIFFVTFQVFAFQQVHPSSLLVLMVQLAKGIIYKQTNPLYLAFVPLHIFYPYVRIHQKRMPITKSSKFPFKENTMWKCHYFRCVCVAWHGMVASTSSPHPQLLFLF